MMMALVAHLSGLRETVTRCGPALGTNNFSSLSPALRRPSFLAYVKRMVGILEQQHQPRDGDLVAIDGMAVTLPATQRHNCAKVNDKAVGGGVVWAYIIDAAKGVCPVKVLKTVHGAWHDSVIMRKVSLIANGPIYLMDRGFYCIDLLAQWLHDQVRFIVRVKQRELKYDLLEIRRPARRYKGKHIALDAVVRLGAPDRKVRPVIRLVIAQLASGDLILGSSQFDWSAEAILDAYHKRWHIERFHRFLKDTLGLAHLYSFHQNGLEFLIYTALLSALLLFFSDGGPDGETIVVLRRILRAVRRALGLGTPWKRNTYSARRSKKTTTNKQEENH